VLRSGPVLLDADGIRSHVYNMYGRRSRGRKRRRIEVGEEGRSSDDGCPSSSMAATAVAPVPCRRRQRQKRFPARESRDRDERSRVPMRAMPRHRRARPRPRRRQHARRRCWHLFEREIRKTKWSLRERREREERGRRNSGEKNRGSYQQKLTRLSLSLSLPLLTAAEITKGRNRTILPV
jgi:hypothetical protein